MSHAGDVQPGATIKIVMEIDSKNLAHHLNEDNPKLAMASIQNMLKALNHDFGDLNVKMLSVFAGDNEAWLILKALLIAQKKNGKITGHTSQLELE